MSFAVDVEHSHVRFLGNLGKLFTAPAESRLRWHITKHFDDDTQLIDVFVVFFLFLYSFEFMVSKKWNEISKVGRDEGHRAHAHTFIRYQSNYVVIDIYFTRRDCGGQESFMEQYFASQKDNIFRNVEVLIYVFDVESRELDNDMHYYQSCLEAIYKVTPDPWTWIPEIKPFLNVALLACRIRRRQKSSV